MPSLAAAELAVDIYIFDVFIVDEIFKASVPNPLIELVIILSLSIVVHGLPGSSKYNFDEDDIYTSFVGAIIILLKELATLPSLSIPAPISNVLAKEAGGAQSAALFPPSSSVIYNILPV
jgi:hypothetical protein